jgi:hypothetical protein
MHIRNDIFDKKQEIEKWIAEFRPKHFIHKQLQCKPSTLNSYLKKMGIVYNGNRGCKGYKTDKKRVSAIEYSKKETAINSTILRRKLIEDKIKEDKCELCRIDEWMGKKIKLELHHKDLNHFNNNLENLQILCPNCHSLIPNHQKNENTKRLSICEKTNFKKQKYGSRELYFTNIKQNFKISQQKYINLVLNSDIDFSKFGWVNKVSKIINQKPNKVNKWIKNIMPEFYKEKCFKRKHQKAL